jgi:hypothetical protein
MPQEGRCGPCVTGNAGSFLTQGSELHFGFTATACRSIFATVFAQVYDTNNARSIVLRLLNASTGDQLI